jgi:hypothetical protein
MQDSKPKKFYWFEGVTRTEVIRSLSDTRPSPLWNQPTRRTLVVAAIITIIALALLIFVVDTKLRSYLEVILLVASLVFYTNLRKGVRHISDAPNELLDERQIAIRDAAYTVAYRWLACLSVIYFFAGISIANAKTTTLFQVPTGLILSYVMCMAALPVMVVAWNLPSEPTDAPHESSS